MKDNIKTLLTEAVSRLQLDGVIPADVQPDIQLNRTKDKSHGDYATNLAMVLAKVAARKPRELAELIVKSLPQDPVVEKIDIAGPGFINFHLRRQATLSVIGTILDRGDTFGKSDIGKGHRVQVEFVSANPTGPLHVGHGRGAAYGAAVADLLEAAGYDVHREYYVNDAGRQMDILAASVWLRYLMQCGEHFEFPSNGYKGEYVKEIAEQLFVRHQRNLHHPADAVMTGIPADEPQGGDKEKHIDALVMRARELLGPDHYREVFDLGLNVILDGIRDDLKAFGVEYDEWYSERTLEERGLLQQAIERLKADEHVYEKEGALWFRSTDFGDEKDRVIVRENGQTTYFAADIAYHMDKLERGFDRVIDIWGADHHGYVPRVKAALKALGEDTDKLDVLLVQFAILYREGRKVQMSTRSGSFVTLRELCEEVGAEAARFFYVMRKCEQHLDFDLDLAKSQSADNPLYYIQYAHARICSVLRQLEEKDLDHDRQHGLANLDLLSQDHEIQLIDRLSSYPELVVSAAIHAEPHQVVHYLRDLANDFHTYYNAHQFLVDEETLRNARLCLISAARQVVKNGLSLLGASAPEVM